MAFGAKNPFKMKVNKQRGNPRAGQKYMATTENGKKVHRYYDKSGNMEKSVVVKGAMDEAKKRSTIPTTKYSKKKPRNIRGSFGAGANYK